ncbi:MAG TPA: glycosyl hydrolase [Fimbriimonas sp.]
MARSLAGNPYWRSAIAAMGCAVAALALGDLRSGFVDPPSSSRPWVYWFWLNGNVNRAGVTADLEAMRRTGIGGVLIMETDQGEPLGPVPFAGDEWRALFRHVVNDGSRLGIQVNMNNDAGWCGSGGPWIQPEQSMQKVVWSEVEVEGPNPIVLSFTTKDTKGHQVHVPRPETVAGFYRDIAVYAFPSVGSYRIPDIRGKAGYVRQEFPVPTSYGVAPPGSAIDPAKMVRLKEGEWQVPPGKWTILRMGHTSTGRVNLPAPKSGEGLECDKLSKEGAEAAFDGFMAKLIRENGPRVGKTLVRTHIDSWEIGSQNWTLRFPEEFRKRRGYDIFPYLPVFSGRVVGSLEGSERFLWDLRQTISDLVLENYAGHMRTLANRHGIQLSIEAYGDVCVDDLAYAGRADEPMTEFWTWGGSMSDPATRTERYLYEMASAAHVYGKRILGAEAFTSNDGERWLHHPGTIKGLGDWQFSRGVNRMVFHRYAMQPFLQVRPGMSMGPWGLHYERTNTWWELSGPWHRYLARCQYLLQQGLPVADVLYLAPEGAPSSFIPPEEAIHGLYRADACPPDALMKRASVRNGQIVFPDGMSYHALVLHPSRVMSPTLWAKVLELSTAGATVVGLPPVDAPGLSPLPQRHKEHQVAQRGKQQSVDEVLRSKGVLPDFEADRALSATHRRIGNLDVYFVANPRAVSVNALCRFRVNGKTAEFWDAETGSIGAAPFQKTVGGRTQIPITLGPMGSTFVVFRPGRPDPVVSFTRNGRDVLQRTLSVPGKVVVKRALWGPAGDEGRTKDVTRQVQAIVDRKASEFQVASLAAEGDPAFNIVKTLRLDYTVDGKPVSVRATDPETVTLPMPQDLPMAAAIEGTTPRMVVRQPGSYSVRWRSGRSFRTVVPPLPEAIPLHGDWTLEFPPNQGAPASMALPRLSSWSESAIPGVRFFSGTATYRKTFTLPMSHRGPNYRHTLDLGRVEAYAQVRLNGKDLGILWRAPYTVDVTRWLKVGENLLEARVTNLWPNRMIGDEHLPPDSDRNPSGNLKAWPDWLLRGERSPAGRQTFSSWNLWRRGDPLQPSGLLGPVAIRTEAVARL